MLYNEIVNYLLGGNDIDEILPYIAQEDYNIVKSRIAIASDNQINVLINNILINLRKNGDGVYEPKENYKSLYNEHFDYVKRDENGTIEFSANDNKQYMINNNLLFVEDELVKTTIVTFINNVQEATLIGKGIMFPFFNKGLSVILVKDEIVTKNEFVSTDFELKNFECNNEIQLSPFVWNYIGTYEYTMSFDDENDVNDGLLDFDEDEFMEEFSFDSDQDMLDLLDFDDIEDTDNKWEKVKF